MKKAIEVVEVPDEGLVALLNRRVTVFCANYIYSGKLVGINDSCIQLEDAGIVYETGELDASKFKDFQKFKPKAWYIQMSAIESFGEANA